MRSIRPSHYAYQCLQRANIEHGINTVELLAYTVPIENSITIQTRSIMGTEIPHVKYVPDAGKPTYSFSTTHESIDQAKEAFRRGKGSDDQAVHGRECRLPACKQHQKDAEACQRTAEHHDPDVLLPRLHDHERPGGKGPRGIHKTESDQTNETKKRMSPHPTADREPCLCTAPCVCFYAHPAVFCLSARLSVLFPIMPVRHVRFTVGRCAFPR